MNTFKVGDTVMDRKMVIKERMKVTGIKTDAVGQLICCEWSDQGLQQFYFSADRLIREQDVVTLYVECLTKAKDFFTNPSEAKAKDVLELIGKCEKMVEHGEQERKMFQRQRELVQEVLLEKKDSPTCPCGNPNCTTPQLGKVCDNLRKKGIKYTAIDPETGEVINPNNLPPEIKEYLQKLFG